MSHMARSKNECDMALQPKHEKMRGALSLICQSGRAPAMWRSNHQGGGRCVHVLSPAAHRRGNYFLLVPPPTDVPEKSAELAL